MSARHLIGATLGSLLVLAVSCGDDPDNDDDGGSGQGLSGSTGQGCSVPDDCFGDVALRDDIQGGVHMSRPRRGGLLHPRMRHGR